MDTTTIDTPQGQLQLHVCKDGDNKNTDWISIYNASFPPDQQQPIDELKKQIGDGSMELDETRDQSGRILCMTLSEIFRPKDQHISFVLACYTAVVPTMRGIGIGSVHRRKLEQLLRQEYGSYLGMFTEIESTKQHTDDPQLAQTRVRRKNFFLKLGLIPLDVPYRFPSYDGGQPLEGELLWYPFGAAKLTPEQLERVIFRIYTEGYGLGEDDEFVNAELSATRAALSI